MKRISGDSRPQAANGKIGGDSRFARGVRACARVIEFFFWAVLSIFVAVLLSPFMLVYAPFVIYKAIMARKVRGLTFSNSGGDGLRDAQESAGEESAAARRHPPKAHFEEAETDEGRKRGRYRTAQAAAKQAQKFRWIAGVGIFVLALMPTALLLKFAILAWFPATYQGSSLHYAVGSIGRWPVVAFITGTFVSFIAVFGFLAKGAFGHSRKIEDDDESSGTAASSVGEQVSGNISSESQ